MKLTKEELTKKMCVKAYQSRMGRRCFGSCKKYTSKECVECQKGWDIIYDLINEHFDNPPLRFEELKVDMWVWVCKDSAYGKILGTKTLNGVQFVVIAAFCNMERIIEFDSTKFHLREVK